MTGGLGVIGARIVSRLVERGLAPIVAHRNGNLSLLAPGVADRITLVSADVADPDSCRALFDAHPISHVVHAAVTLGGVSGDLLGAVQVNAMGTVNLLEAAAAARITRFVYLSSRAVYGDMTGDCAHPSYRPVHEDDALRPARIYDACKAFGEQVGQAYARRDGFAFAALRFAHIYGPGKLLRQKTMSTTSRMIENARAGKPTVVPRGGDQRDDMIYVDDAADGVLAALFAPRLNHQAYNIATGRGATLRDFADAVRAVFPTARIEVGPGLDMHGIGINYCGVLDNRRAREDLGFTPQLDLAAGVARYVAACDALGLPAVGD